MEASNSEQAIEQQHDMHAIWHQLKQHLKPLNWNQQSALQFDDSNVLIAYFDWDTGAVKAIKKINVVNNASSFLEGSEPENTYSNGIEWFSTRVKFVRKPFMRRQGGILWKNSAKQFDPEKFTTVEALEYWVSANQTDEMMRQIILDKLRTFPRYVLKINHDKGISPHLGTATDTSLSYSLVIRSESEWKASIKKARTKKRRTI